MKNKSIMIVFGLVIFLYLLEQLSSTIFSVVNAVLFWIAVTYFGYKILTFFYYEFKNKDKYN